MEIGNWNAAIGSHSASSSREVLISTIEYPTTAPDAEISRGIDRGEVPRMAGRS